MKTLATLALLLGAASAFAPRAVAVTRARRTLYIPPKLDALRTWCEQQDAAPGAPATPRPRGGLSLAALMGGGGMLSGTVSQSQRSVRRAGPDGW